MRRTRIWNWIRLNSITTSRTQDHRTRYTYTAAFYRGSVQVTKIILTKKDRYFVNADAHTTPSLPIYSFCSGPGYLRSIAHTLCFTGALIVAWLTWYAAGRVVLNNKSSGSQLSLKTPTSNLPSFFGKSFQMKKESTCH